MIRTEMLEVMREKKMKQMAKADSALLEAGRDCRLLQEAVNMMCDCYCGMPALGDNEEIKLKWKALGTSIDHAESIVNMLEKDLTDLKKRQN